MRQQLKFIDPHGAPPNCQATGTGTGIGDGDGDGDGDGEVNGDGKMANGK